MRRLLPILLTVASCAAPPKFSSEGAIARLERDVRFLASDEMKGRNNATPEGAKAAEFVARAMEEAGLRPAGEEGGWFQTIPGRRGVRGRNVIGALPGPSGRWIVIGAHHDGLGIFREKIHNGADDNASGVAVVLEAARRLSAADRRHGLLFCSFDAEEDGLVGSRYFVESGRIPVESIGAMICLDLVGGAFLPGDERRVFALGSESSARLFEWIGGERGRADLEVERAGIYVIEPMGPVLARSDYSAFRHRKVPFVFLSTGTPWYYHTPDDDVERLDFAKIDRVADLVARLAGELSTAPALPEWRDPAPDLEEDADLMRSACRRVLDHPAIETTARLRAAVSDALDGLEAERKSVQKAMMALFQVAATQRPAH